MNHKIAINPCHENWFSMKENELGRYCESCAKNVIDFTQSDSKQIKQFIFQNSDQQICGRFRKEQIELFNLFIVEDEFIHNSNFWHRFLLILLCVFGAELFQVNILFSQELSSNKDTLQTEFTENKLDSLQTEEDSLFLKKDSIVLKHQEIKLPKHEMFSLGDVSYVSGSIYVQPEETEKTLPNLSLLIKSQSAVKSASNSSIEIASFSKLKTKRRKKKSNTNNNFISNEFILPEKSGVISQK